MLSSFLIIALRPHSSRGWSLDSLGTRHVLTAQQSYSINAVDTDWVVGKTKSPIEFLWISPPPLLSTFKSWIPCPLIILCLSTSSLTIRTPVLQPIEPHSDPLPILPSLHPVLIPDPCLIRDLNVNLSLFTLLCILWLDALSSCLYVFCQYDCWCECVLSFSSVFCLLRDNRLVCCLEDRFQTRFLDWEWEVNFELRKSIALSANDDDAWMFEWEVCLAMIRVSCPSLTSSLCPASSQRIRNQFLESLV